MNDVQLEHGHIRIANRLFEAVLAAGFTVAQLRIVLAIIRLTYGWRQKTVCISQGEFAKLLGFSPAFRTGEAKRVTGAFRRALQSLIDAGVLLCDRGVGAGRSAYMLQKDFTKWGVFAVAPGRLEALWAERPESPAILFAAEEVDGPHGVTSTDPAGLHHGAESVEGSDPTGTHGVTPQGHTEGPQGVTPTRSKCDTPPKLRARKDRKDRKDSTTSTTTTREERVKSTLSSLDPMPSAADVSSAGAPASNGVPHASQPPSPESKRRSTATAKPPKAPQWPHFPEADCHSIYETWTDRRGAVNYGQLRNAFGPLYPATGPRYQLAQLVEAIDVFAELAEADRPEFSSRWNVRTFAADVPRWVRLGAMPHVDDWGIPTERGRLTKLFGEAS